jgi:hypothetical protein
MSGGDLPPLPALDTIRARLAEIFPAGTEGRSHLIREIAVRTIFVMFYVGAVEGLGGWLRPNQVTRMTDAQAGRTSGDERRAWREASLRREAGGIPDRWYATDTREPIRDETLRSALVPVGAVVERDGLAKTSATPRWALAAEFAELLLVSDPEFEGCAAAWRERHLTPSARARIALVRRGITGSGEHEVVVRFPSGATRTLSPGTSSEIARAVVEEFAPRFLGRPGVLWVSETSRRDEAADLELARLVHLPIEPNLLLPDVVLVDLPDAGPPRFVFVELVTSDGPMTEDRKRSFEEVLRRGGHDPRHAAFGTAFLDRGDAAFRRLAPRLAWDSFVWFASEPDRLVVQLGPSLRGRGVFDILGS